MIGETYRLNGPILGILSPLDEARIAVTIPENALVTVVAGPLNGVRLVQVLWEASEVLVFTADLREYGSVVEPLKAIT
jgi:hypothetical protein